MRTILREEIITGALQRIKKQCLTGYFDGNTLTDYFENCRWYLMQYDCMLIFTRDIGHHTSGWFKNPDYERCYHLSLSFRGRSTNKKTVEKILDNLYGEDKRKVWVEPPFSEVGKSHGVYHYRLFCNEFWIPIIPRGEVYSKEFTEKGWKSYSELHAK
jgi:hypothetical protein